MTWFACCEWCSRFSSTTTRATRKVPLCQWRHDCAHTAGQTFWETDADRRGEGLSNSSFRPCSAAMTLKDLLNNDLKRVKRCQILLVGENKKNNAEKGEYPTARERHNSRQANELYRPFLFFYSSCSTALETQTFLYSQPLQYIPTSVLYQSLILSK